MKSIAVALMISAVLVTLLTLGQLDVSPLILAPVMVILGVVAASTMAGGLTWLTVVFGAVGTLAFGWLRPWSLTAALVVVAASWVIPRAFQTRSHRDLVVFAAAALPASLVAGLVTAYFAQASFVQHLAACVFAGAALAVAHVVVRVDAPLAHALFTAGRALEGDVGRALRDAADAHRSGKGKGGDIPAAAWRALVRDADARLALRGAKGDDAARKRAELDGKILRTADEIRPAAKEQGVREDAAPPTSLPAEEPAAESAVQRRQDESKAVSASPAVEALVP